MHLITGILRISKKTKKIKKLHIDKQIKKLYTVNVVIPPCHHVTIP